MARAKVQIGGAFGCKLAFSVVALAAIAASLLTIRQLRTQAAHEFASLRLRVMRVDEASGRLRADIARHIGPAELRERLAELDAEGSGDSAPDAALVGLETADER
ncbi:MAG: hypothetical protein NCW75_00880 [Phycisphaera sp.]|nr:MAG: hypothetical protein NCW75_00880 [Phycisphaera sp.]